MLAGRLRDLVTFQEDLAVPDGSLGLTGVEPDGEQDSYGQPVSRWADVVTVHGEVRDLAGREYVSMRLPSVGTAAEVTARIRLRYRTGLRPEMRAVSRGRVFDVVSIVDPDGRRRELHVMVKERLP